MGSVAMLAFALFHMPRPNGYESSRRAEANVHHLLFNRPDQQAWPGYALYVNATTGKRWSFSQIVERIRDRVTALGTGIDQAGVSLVVIPQSRTWFCFVLCVSSMFLVVSHDLFPASLSISPEKNKIIGILRENRLVCFDLN
jgi:hypothetical protein